MELLTHPRTMADLKALQRPGFYIVHGPAGIGKKTIVNEVLKGIETQLITTDKASIKRRQVIDVFDHFKLKSGHKSYVLIDEAEKMTDYAQNALLKTLEELPPFAGVVMITDEPDKLLPTVRSRAFSIPIPAPSRQQLIEWIDTITDDKEKKQALVELAGLKPALIRNLLDNPETLEQRLSQHHQIKQLGEGELSERLQAARALQTQMPHALGHITEFARYRLRQEQDRDWHRVVMACDLAQKLLKANCSHKLVLDVVALRETEWRI